MAVESSVSTQSKEWLHFSFRLNKTANINYELIVNKTIIHPLNATSVFKIILQNVVQPSFPIYFK